MERGTPLPTGTITFLFTEIEESARLWERTPGAREQAVLRHDALAAAMACDRRGGDNYGVDVNRCALLRAVAHGGQILAGQRLLLVLDNREHLIPACARLAERAELHLFGREQGEWPRRLDAERDNIREALLVADRALGGMAQE